MASPICTLSFCCLSSVRNIKSTMYSIPSCSSSSASTFPSCIKTLNCCLSSRFSRMGLCHFTPWSGLRYMGIAISTKTQKLGNRAKRRGKVVYASLFGVGAPEALVIGVVALLVFGPKGLAEVARNLGKTLRAFQPTIRELQEVSREFKSTLEREISLDDDPRSVNNMYGSNNANITSSQPVSSFHESQTVPVADPNGAPPNNGYSSEEFLKITEEQLKASAAVAQDAASYPSENQIETSSQPQDGASPVAYSSEEYLKITEEQLKALAAAQQNALSSQSENQIEIERQPQAAIQESAPATPPVQKPESET
uniref:Sec-independent protein translocase protein TATB, chloroplastic n=1 Tax=Opuntia streptacantha TaxID=393608 RepID=A0A7C9D7L3_OPUST